MSHNESMVKLVDWLSVRERCPVQELKSGSDWLLFFFLGLSFFFRWLLDFDSNCSIDSIEARLAWCTALVSQKYNILKRFFKGSLIFIFLTDFHSCTYSVVVVYYNISKWHLKCLNRTIWVLVQWWWWQPQPQLVVKDLVICLDDPAEKSSLSMVLTSGVGQHN